MLTDEQRSCAAQAIRTLQIVVAALITGVLTFLIFVVVTTERNGVAPAEPPLMIYFGLAFAFIATMAAAIVPRILVAKHRSMIAAGQSVAPLENQIQRADLGDIGPLLNSYQVKTIVGAAILEGAAFFNTYLFMSEQSMISLALAVLLLLGIAMMFPFRSRVIAWLESELTTIKQLRNFHK